ncbi:DUF3563 family protein [Variovorax sp. Sphag1AA]|uniref:DUF3563 family protein n=1 Tax=Variovorax sp. Sphag1AA TaxID=2587027 RepID=UPI001620CD27|nr:DUF3563 family protein [Variovorax sp. Sphag1AA]
MNVLRRVGQGLEKARERSLCPGVSIVGSDGLTRANFKDTYLAGAVDIYDLERRIKHLDQRTAQRPFDLQHSI